MVGTVVMTGTVQLVEVHCGKCAMVFAMPKYFYDRASEHGEYFRCPNPKCEWKFQHYTTSEIDRLKKQVERADALRKTAESIAADARERQRRAEASANTVRGHMTRLRRRVAAGVCPCCQRSFQNVARHMASQHPDFPKPETS